MDKQNHRRRPLAIETASGKESLSALKSSGDFEDLERYFWSRSEWAGGYPLVHDYLVTYGAFQDLHLDHELAYRLLPDMIRLCESVPDPYFHSALALLVQMIPDDAIGIRPDGFSDHVLRLKLRAEKLSFLPNLSSTWDSFALMQCYLKADGDYLAQYSPRQLRLGPERWPGLSSPLDDLGNRQLPNCRADFSALRRMIQNLGCAPGARRLVFSTKIEKTLYWVWQLPGEEGTARLHRLVFLRQPLEGASGLGYWDLYRQFHESANPKTISDRLLKIEFSVNALVDVPDSPAWLESSSLFRPKNCCEFHIQATRYL